MKKKKNPIMNFETGSRLPIVFYAIAAVILSCLFMIITLITSGFSFTLGRELSSGDLNNDGVLNAADALHIIMRENKNLDFNGAQIDAADVNSDGKINDIDAKLIIQYASETSKKLGVSAVGNTKMESPSPVKKDDASSENTEQQEDSFVRTGNSYGAAFSTSEAGIYSTARIANKWQANGKYYYQINISLKNYSGQYISDSSLEIDFSSGVTVEKSWKCSAENGDFGINITTQTYQYVPNGGTLNCGIIVSSPSEIEVESVS